MAGIQGPEPSSATFPGALAGSELEGEQVDLKSSVQYEIPVLPAAPLHQPLVFVFYSIVYLNSI